MKPDTKKEIRKWIVYILILIVLYTLQTNPYLITIEGARPNMIFAFCIFIAIWEGEFSGAIFGAVTGLFLDFSAGSYAGVYGLLLLITCFVVSLCIQKYFRATFKNAMLMFMASYSAVFAIVIFFDDILRYDNALQAFGLTTAVHFIYTFILAIPIYLLTFWFNKTLNKHGKVVKK